MPSRALITLTGMLVTATSAGVAHSQAPQRQSLAERMAAIGRSWTQDEPEPAQVRQPAPNNNQQRSATRPAPAEPRQGRFPQIDARALLPLNLFGADDDGPSTTVPPPTVTYRQPAARVRRLAPGQRTMTSSDNLAVRPQPNGTATPAPRMAARPRAGSVQERDSLHDNFTLPGLGGSRLPAGAVESGDPGTNQTNNVEISGDVVSDYSANREGGHTNDFHAPGRAASGATTPSARQSPRRRVSMHIDPTELRRELAGAFPDATENTFSTPSDSPKTKSPEPTVASQSSSARTVEDSRPVDAAQKGTADEDSTSSSIQIPSQSIDAPFSLPIATESAPQVQTLEIVESKETPAPVDTGFRPTDSPPSETRSRSDRGSEAKAPADSNLDESDISFGFIRSQSAPSTHVTPTNPLPSEPSASRRREAFGEAGQPTSTDPSVLVSHQTPVITTDIRGPKQILVGREATYRVRLQNQGETSAEGIIAHVRIPSDADVIDTVTTQGTIGQSQDAQTAGSLQWQLTRLEAGATETLDVRLVPRSSRPLELGVSWTLAPVGSRAVVEVQEPKLRLHVSGPDEVLFGKAQLYRLTLTNPGTGVAQGIKIDLLPPGGGEDAVTSHPVGDLGAGTSQSIEVELTAREAGKLFIKAIASADGGLSSEASKEVFCRKPELEVDWRGPETKYTGTEAIHFFRVRNPGTAPAENVTVTVALPSGTELLSASEGDTFNESRGEVAWHIGSLGPGDDRYMELKCLVSTPGRNEMKITAATAKGDLADTHIAETNVVALADLKLEVSDPKGPVAVGDEALYEIRVRNRGQGAAQDINVVALFSEGVEPVTVEGAMYSVADGRVSFRTIDDLPAGKQIVLRIRANGRQAGTHVFRAEVLCRDLDIKLAAEETTRFYADDVFDSNAGANGFRPSGVESRSTAEPSAPSAVEVGDRYQTGTIR